MDAYIAGSFSGLVQIVIGHPLDTYKVWLQTKQPNRNLKKLYYGIRYPLLISCVHNSVLFGTNHNLGRYIDNQWITGFLTGIVSGFICGPMELFKIREQAYKTKPKLKHCFIGIYPTLIRESVSTSIYFGTYHYLHDQLNYSLLYSGGISGVVSWLITHPIDTVKSRIQSGSVSNLKDALSIKGLWRGIECTLLRAFLVNSTGFWVYEKSLNYFKS